MLQPFELFKEEYLPRLIRLKKTYLVSQSYAVGNLRTMDPDKTGILVTSYDDKGIAIGHLNAVRNDRYGAIIDLQNKKHLEQFRGMLRETAPYAVYWALVKDAEALRRNVNTKYKDHMRRWLLNNTQWRISADDSIRPQLQLIFGELFVTLKRGSQEVRLSFRELEKS